jgi:hypothetical protein
LRYSEEWIEKQRQIAIFGYKYFLKLFPVTIVIILILTVGCAVLGLLGYISFQNVVSVIILAGLVIFFVLIPMWSILFYGVKTVRIKYEIHNWGYDHYGNRWWWSKISDRAHHIVKYALLEILVFSLFYLLIYLYFRK